MKSNTEIPSLRPYLEPHGAKFRLEFSLISQDRSVDGKAPFPFLVINESDPLGRLIEARFVTDAGSKIKRVFVLLQKDEYLLPRDELWPVSNQDVDECWQRAFSSYSGKAKDGSVVVLSDQIEKDGRLSPLQSLFYCNQERIFFHPQCPTCGSPLQQCYDDHLLTGVGLQPYSTSLKRYLYCPSCFDLVGESDFFIHALESSDPPILKDRWDLVKEFGQLTEGKKHMDQFPCAKCPNHQECYGADGLALSRIVPVSFYSFHMLIFEAMSVNAPDFLSLISGASLEELEAHLAEKQEPGRISCLKTLERDDPVKAPFIFGADERYFLEVLYLKLSFLGELAQTVFSGLDTYRHPDLGLSLNRIWVKLSDQSGLLPFFWNFRVRLVDVGGSAVKMPYVSQSPPYYGIYFLGLVWFYTLLVNKKQGVSEVYMALEQGLEKMASHDDASVETLPESGWNGSCLPENIFWNPESRMGKTLGEDWLQLWEKSVGLGWSLLNASLRGDPKWSIDEFRQEMESLREEVKAALFQQGPVTVGHAGPKLRQALAVDQQEHAPDNEAIHDILVNITERWRAEIDAERHEIVKDKVEIKDELEKTVIFSTIAGEEPDQAVDGSQDETEVLETVILSAKDFRQDVSAPPQPEEEPMPETVIISSSEMTKEAPPAPPEKDVLAPAFPKEEALPETVIISPSEKAEHPARTPETPQSGRVDVPGKDDTALKKEQGVSEVSKKAEDKSEEDDFLAQTVILTPDRLKERK